MLRLLLFFTAFLIIASCKQRAGTEKSPFVAPFVDSTYARHMVDEFKNGSVLFNDNCVACHAAPGKLACPNILEHLFDNLPKPAEEYFTKYVCNGLALRKSGDKYANAIYEKYNHTFDHQFNKLSQDDIDQLIIYLKVADKAGERGFRLINEK